MRRLFLFLYKYRAFLTFLFLELVSVWLIVQNNTFQGAKFFNSSNRLAANVLSTSGGVSDYFNLGQVNQQLAEENAELRRKLFQMTESLYDLNVSEIKDEQVVNKYNFQTAKVIHNSIDNFDNYITINRGLRDNVESGMAVISSQGVVGKVKSVSRNFSVITSVLHGSVQISSTVKRTGDLATTKWNGIDPNFASLLHVPRHITLDVGDTIVTSGFNAVFPPGIVIGYITEFDLSEGQPFYDVKIDLAVDFNQLSYVYLVSNNLKNEQDSLLENSIN